MDPVVELDPTDLAVHPGGQAQVRVQVRNRDTIVERYQLAVVGDAAGWSQVVPGELLVDAGGEGQATVMLAPPTGPGGPAGRVPFGVRAVSAVNAESAMVAEGDVQVGEVADVALAMRPVTSKGRWSGRHRVEVTNRGNVPARVALAVSDPDERLGSLLAPEVVDVPPGGSATARLKVRTRDPSLRGTPQRLPFRVVGERLGPDGQPLPLPPPPVAGLPYNPAQPGVDGAFMQQPILSRSTVMVGVAALGGVAGLAFLLNRGGEPAAQDGIVAPEAPQGVQAAAAGPDAVQVSWRGVSGAEGYKVLMVDPAARDADEPPASASIEVPAEQTIFRQPGLAPATDACFQVLAVRGEAASQRSEVACATTAAAPADGGQGEPGDGDAGGPGGGGGDAATTTTLGGGGGTAPTVPGGGGGSGGGAEAAPDLQWIALARAFAADDVTARERAEAAAEDLRAQGHRAAVLDTADYPALRPPVPGFWVYVGNFPDRASAQAYCTSRLPGCFQVFDTSPEEG